MRTILCEGGLGKIMSGAETAPDEPEESAAAAAVTTYQQRLAQFKEKNGKLYTRLLLATTDSPQGYSSPASQVVQSYAPIGDEEFGDGRAAFVALQAKYRIEGAFRMQQLHEQFASVAVTAADAYDPSRAIQELRRICVELKALGDNVVEARKSHALIKSLPDKHYAAFKTVLLCENPNIGDGGFVFDDVARRATTFHAMQIRGKVQTHDDGSGSHGRAMNTVTHGGARGFRKQGGRGGRSRRGNGQGNGGGTANGSTGDGASNGNNNHGGTSNRKSHGGTSAGNAQGARGRGRGNHNSGGREKGRDTGQNRQGRCRYCHNSRDHGWDDCPLRISQEAEDAKEQAHSTQETTTQAWYTRVQVDSSQLEDFAISIGNNMQVQKQPAAAQLEERAADYMRVPEVLAAVLPEERAADHEQVLSAPAAELPMERTAGDEQELDAPAAAMAEDLAATTHHQAEDTPDATEIVAYSNVFQVEKGTPPDVDDTTVYIDSAASSHMVCANSRMSQQVLDPADCAVRIIGSCGTSNATKKGTLKFGIRNDQNKIVPVALEVLLVQNLGANIFSVGALAEKGVMCDFMSTPPAIRNGTHVFPMSKEVPRMYVVKIFIDDVNLGAVDVYRTKVDADLWHRRMGHCNSRALQQLANKETTGVKFDRNIEPGDCGVCAVGDSKKSSHPPSNRPRADTRLAILSADVWGPHPIKSYGGCQNVVMFTDDSSRMRFGFPITTKDETAEALQQLVQEEADPLGLNVGTVHCDGGGEFKGRFRALCVSLGIKIETSPPYSPEGNSIAERGFGSIFGTTRKLLLGAPHLPDKLWAEAFKTAIYIKNRTPTDVLDGKAPLEVWTGEPLGNMLHIHEWGSLAFKHEEARFRHNKLAARAKKMHLVGYNSNAKTYRLWDPAVPWNITNSNEVSFRERDMRDVAKPQGGDDPFRVQNQTIYQPGSTENNEEDQEDEQDHDQEATPTGSQTQPQSPRRSARTPVPRQVLNLCTTEETYERTERALVTGSELGNIGTGRPGEVGYMPSDPANYDEAVSGPESKLWHASMRDEEASLVEHDVFDWVDPPEGEQLIPSKFMYKWKYNQDAEPIRPKSRIVVQGFHEADTGADKAAPVASMESVHLVVATAANNGYVLKQADIKTAYLNARIPDNAKPIYVVPPKGFQCSTVQAGQVWRLKAWLYGLRLSPKGWNGTFHKFLLAIGFVQSAADHCLYTLNAGEVLLLVYVDDLLFSGANAKLVTTILEQVKERFETVDLGDARFLLGMAIQRNVDAGTILLTQESYTKAVLSKFGMLEVHPTKTPAETGPISTVEETTLSSEDTTMFRSATGSALYLCRGSRPEISHAVLVLTRSMAKPGPRAMARLKRLLRYLKGTISIGITYSEDSEGGDKLTAYADSDFAGDQDDRRSTTGVVLFLAGGPVDWRSVKQTVVSLSSVEAEYVAMSKACKMIIHFRHLMDTIYQNQTEATLLFEDSMGAIATSANSKVTPRTKHIDVKYHHVRSLIENKVVAVEYIKTDLQKADILTKSLGAVKFIKNRILLLGV